MITSVTKQQKPLFMDGNEHWTAYCGQFISLDDLRDNLHWYALNTMNNCWLPVYSTLEFIWVPTNAIPIEQRPTKWDWSNLPVVHSPS